MNIGTRIDLKSRVYKDQLKPVEIFNKLIQILDSLETKYSERALLRTRDDDNEHLHSSSTNYFTYVEPIKKDKPDTIFAGAMEKPPRGNKAPVIRVRSSNPLLAKIPGTLKFPFEQERNPKWTNIIISSSTIEVLKEILHSEVENYFASPQG